MLGCTCFDVNPCHAAETTEAVQQETGRYVALWIMRVDYNSVIANNTEAYCRDGETVAVRNVLDSPKPLMVRAIYNPSSEMYDVDIKCDGKQQHSTVHPGGSCHFVLDEIYSVDVAVREIDKDEYDREMEMDSENESVSQ